MSIINQLTAIRSIGEIIDLIKNAPHWYAEWWIGLFHKSPEHVFIETSLIIFIILLFVTRNTVDPKKKSKEANKFSEKEVKWLVDTWEPEPLVPKVAPIKQKLLDLTPVIERVDGLHIQVRGIEKPVMNLTSFDFLGLNSLTSVKDVARKALEKYGCGSCGPRGFYGSIDEHIIFEKNLSKFMNVEETILYSDGASTVSSVIAAFSKRGDLLIVDEACSEPIMTGVTLSRSIVRYYKHNDMKDLESILSAIKKEDERLKIDTTQQRRFIVTEGLFRNTGEIVNLPEMMRLKKKYFYRLIVDESLSFGTLGKTGRGISDHFNMDIRDIDIDCFSIESSLSTIGGCCIGSKAIVDHQRLSGSGYCFSASAPPFTAAVASHTLELLQREPERRQDLAANSDKLFKKLAVLADKGLVIMNSTATPVIHLAFDSKLKLSKEEEESRLITLSKKCLESGVAIFVSKFALLNKVSWKPSLRLSASAVLSEQDVNTIIKTLENALESM